VTGSNRSSLPSGEAGSVVRGFLLPPRGVAAEAVAEPQKLAARRAEKIAAAQFDKQCETVCLGMEIVPASSVFERLCRAS